TPSNPNWYGTPVGSGMNGCQLAGFTKNAPTPMNARITVTLMATMMLFTVADSDTPRTRSSVTARVMNTAGRLNAEVTISDAFTGTTVAMGSCAIEPAGRISLVPSASSRKWVVDGSSTLKAPVSTAWVSPDMCTSIEFVSANPPFTGLTTS